MPFAHVPTRMPLLTVTAGMALAGLTPDLAAQSLVEATYDTPSMDRWNYPFNSTPGNRFFASSFGAILIEGFDDRDAQFIVGYQTNDQITPALDADQYRLARVRLVVTVSNDNEFRYDPTSDSYLTYAFEDETPPVPDADLGRPIELFATGYRNGFDQSSWGEFSPFGGTPVIDPAQSARNAFAAVFDDDGVATDVSNNLKEGFEAVPLAVGTTDAVLPGEFVPADTEFTFDIDLCAPGARRFISDSLAAGEVRFSLTSLQPAAGGPGGPTTDPLYPIYYTRENPIAQFFDLTARLEIDVRVGSAGDYNGDGIFDFFDASAFLADFSNGVPGADLTGDCIFDFFDVALFLQEFSDG